MKRGLIAWDRSELPPEVFDRRASVVREALSAMQLGAMAVYSDLWRSNEARFFSNYMPYFNRALLVVPQSAEGALTLLCGLSPRVYPWIKTVTPIQDVRPAGNFAQSLLKLCAERNWKRLGILSMEEVPHDMFALIRNAGIDAVNIPAEQVYRPAEDPAEAAIRRKAAAIARTILEEELHSGSGHVDRHFASVLERKFRRAGAEDLIIMLAHGDGAPALPDGRRLEPPYSVSVALEYRGHWARVTRPWAVPEASRQALQRFQKALDAGLAHGSVAASASGKILVEDMTGPYPFHCGSTRSAGQGSFVAAHVTCPVENTQLLYGDTCRVNGSRLEVL